MLPAGSMASRASAVGYINYWQYWCFFPMLAGKHDMLSAESMRSLAAYTSDGWLSPKTSAEHAAEHRFSTPL